MIRNVIDSVRIETGHGEAIVTKAVWIAKDKTFQDYLNDNFGVSSKWMRYELIHLKTIDLILASEVIKEFDGKIIEIKEHVENYEIPDDTTE